MSKVRRMFQRLAEIVTPPDYGLCAPDELDEAIRRERSRADRTSGEFAVVSFFGGDKSHDRRSLLPLVDHLKRRSRSVDDLGWGQDNKLWFILSNCSKQSAAKLANKLCRDFSSPSLTLRFMIYHYDANDVSGHRGQLVISNSDPGEIEQLTQKFQCADEPLNCNQSAEAGLTDIADTSTQQDARSMAVLFVRRMPWWKRSIDVIASATGLILLAPLFSVIAITIKRGSPGPVLFKQLRSGHGGRPFLLYKFRSMVVDAETQKCSLLAKNEQDGPAFKMEHDPRVTNVGRILRAFSIDELPQLWNVLRGEMSLVGPRPLPIDEAEACSSWQRQRTDVTPGLTCFWQVKDRRSKIPFVEWARMDISYIRGQCLWLDLTLLAQTLLFVIRRKGV